jgi:hypothetical protein
MMHLALYLKNPVHIKTPFLYDRKILQGIIPFSAYISHTLISISSHILNLFFQFPYPCYLLRVNICLSS